MSPTKHRVQKISAEVLATLHQLDTRWRAYAPHQRAFITGHTHLLRGEYASALPYLETALTSYPQLKEDILYDIAQSALRSGALTRATSAVSALLGEFPESRWSAPARDLQVELAMARRDWDGAAALLQAELAMARDRWRQRTLREQLAHLAVARGDSSAASQAYFALYTSAEYPDEAQRAREGLTLGAKAGGEDPVRHLDTGARQALAERFLQRGLAAEAVEVLHPLRHVPSLLLARAYFRARRYVEAADLYETLWKRDGSLSTLQLYATASARGERTDRAIALQQEIAEQSSGATRLQARAKEAFLFLDSGRYREAAEKYRQWVESARPARLSIDQQCGAWWAIAWSEYRQQHWQAALEAFDHLTAIATARDRQWHARVAYWRGRVLDAAGQRGPARTAWKALARTAAGTYYGTLAAARVKGRKGVETLFRHQSPAVHDMGPMEVMGDTTSAQVRELDALGLWDAAIEAFDHQVRPVQFRPHHQQAIARLGALWGIDPALVERLIWQESANRPLVVSPAGAIGLMQLIPTTAYAMARELRQEPFRVEALFRPLPNLQLGMWYLRTLLTRYDGALPYVLASYNAGEAAVDRWRRTRTGHDLEEFIETIPYRETRQYVMRILQQYW
ncbi:MAG: transglycosylase SLT domain-containing protein [Deltaproteobacteria bacterium]|nr:transglycosylase SLT domain-containing protein [Deltaproteobacteria bacterium]